MGVDSDPRGPWTGRSGRSYERATAEAPRAGLSHRRVVVLPVGEGERATDPPAGRRLELWLPAAGGAAGRQALARELEALELLGLGKGSSPAPRLFDRLVGEEPGGVVDACTTDLERWWLEVAPEAEGMRTLCLALADVCRRAGDWAAAARKEPALARLPPRIRPRSVLRTVGGRWVLSGFGGEALPVLDGAEDGQGTEVLAAVSHFQPPEELFQATGGSPMAGLAWAIGSTFFSLLKLRAFLLSSPGGRRPELPQGGTDSPHLGSHRSALVEEHLRKRPAAFVDQPLDPRQFLYPDRLPERDRRVVAEAVSGLMGPGQPAAEEALARDCLQLLDSALAIDPTRRYLDPLVMAGDFEGLARRVQTVRSGLAAARLVGGGSEAPVAATSGLLEEPTDEAPIPEEASLPPEDTSDSPTAHPAPGPAPATDAVVAPGAPRVPLHQPVEEATPVGRVPPWVRGALVGLALSQAGTLALVGALWTRLPAPPPTAAASSPPAAPVAALLEEVEPPRTPSTPTGPHAESPAREAPAPEAPAPEAPAPEAPAQARPASEQTPAGSARGPRPGAAAEAPTASSSAAPPPAAPPASSGRTASPTAAEVSAPARLLVDGATAMLEGPGGRRSPGEVTPGTWTVLIREGEGWVSACTATVAEGQQALVRCGFGQCRQVR